MPIRPNQPKSPATNTQKNDTPARNSVGEFLARSKTTGSGAKHADTANAWAPTGSAKNSVGEFLKHSATSNFGAHRVPVDVAANLVSQLSVDTGVAPADVLRDLGVPTSEGLALLGQLERFGFVQRREVEGVTLLFLAPGSTR